MIGDLIPRGNKHWKLFEILNKFIEYIFKSQYTQADLEKLNQIVEEHHKCYKSLYKSLKPKHHFMVHYATTIKRCGPLKFLWCMRFEAKHKEAKAYLKNVQSRKNIEQTMCLKSALKFAFFILEHQNFTEPEVTFNTSHLTNLRQEEFFSKINCNEIIDFEKVEVAYNITYKNTLLKSDFYLSISGPNFKLFKIHSFLRQTVDIFVLCYQVLLNEFDEHFQSFIVNCVVANEIYIKKICEFNTYPVNIHYANNNVKYAKTKYV